MQTFLFGRIEPKLYVRIFFAVHECRRADDQDQRHRQRQLWLEHLLHGAALAFEHASGFVSLACPTLACTAWNAASSSTFQFELKRKGSARESQQLALSVSSNFSAAIATSPHGCGSSFL